MLAVILMLQTLTALTVAVSGPPGSPEYLPVRVAAAEGYFGREGLDVTLKSTRAEVGAAEALAQGQADLAATSLEAILRFGPRLEHQRPKLVLGLTAAPPVALLVTGALEGSVRSVRDLAGRRVAIAAPGAPEHTWLTGILSRAGLSVTQVQLVSLGTRSVAAAVDSGDAQAALVHEPAASQLVAENRARVLVDLRTPEGVRASLGVPTVNAAVFARADRRPHDRLLAAFARAVLAAEQLIDTESPAVLASRLPPAIVGSPEEFERRLEASRGLYLPGGTVDPAAVRETIVLVRGHLPLPPTLKVPPPDDLLYTRPLSRAARPAR